MFNALIKSEKFNVTVIKRSSFFVNYPDSVNIREVDLSSVDFIIIVFKGQNIVVFTIDIANISEQKILVAVVVIINMKYFLLSDFDCDLNNFKVVIIFVFKIKIAIYNIFCKTVVVKRDDDFIYIFIYNNVFLD